jgi:hypothetical protein
MSQRPAHDAEASTSRAEQALWQEFRDHSTSINNALTEALWLHGGLSFRHFEVSALRST